MAAWTRCVICAGRNLSSKWPEEDVHSLESLSNFLKQIGVQGEVSAHEVRLCGECGLGVGKAQRRRVQMEEVERIIQSLRIQKGSLQEEYLEELRALQRKLRNPAEENGTGNEEEMSTEALATVKQEIQDVVEDTGGFEDAVPASGSGMEPDANILVLPAIKEEIDPTDFVEVSLLPSDNSVQDQEPLSAVQSESLSAEVTRPNVNDLALPVVVSLAATASVSSVSQRKRTRRRSAPCRVCGKTFYDNSNLLRHIKVHKGERPYKCPLCSKEFQQRVHLQRHKITHGGKKPYGCQHCGRGFSRKQHMERHQRSHPDDVVQAPSEEELRSVKSLPVVEAEGTRPLALPVVPSVPVSSISQTKKKTRVSRAGLPCPYCGKTFGTNFELRHHVYTHTGERPYKCPHCPRAFARRGNLNVHLRSHNGKPFKCPQCEKGFTRKDRFEEHKRTHTGENPYSCSVCGQRFAAQGYMKDHFKRMHRQ